MQRVIIDTNVLVSALIQKNYPYFILYNCILDNLIEMCISDELFQEYLDVLHRPKFSKYPEFIEQVEFVLAKIEEKSIKFVPNQRFDIIADKADNSLLELAAECKADFIITGNTNDFIMPEFRGTRIVTPKDYWDIYREK